MKSMIQRLLLSSFLAFASAAWAEVFLEKVRSVGGQGQLDTRKGAAHGWGNWEADTALFADWFDQH